MTEQNYSLVHCPICGAELDHDKTCPICKRFAQIKRVAIANNWLTRPEAREQLQALVQTPSADEMPATRMPYND